MNIPPLYLNFANLMAFENHPANPGASLLYPSQQTWAPSIFNTPSTPSSSVSGESVMLTPDSGYGSASSKISPQTEMKYAGRTLNRFRKEFCTLCEEMINKTGQRSQGPRRHVMTCHLKRPYYQCPHCEHFSIYDSHHVLQHMKRVHGDSSGEVQCNIPEYTSEIDKWMQTCFREVSFPKDYQRSFDPAPAIPRYAIPNMYPPYPMYLQNHYSSQMGIRVEGPADALPVNTSDGRITPESDENSHKGLAPTPLTTGVRRKRPSAFMISDLLEDPFSSKKSSTSKEEIDVS